MYITALNYISKLAIHKIWVKPSGEMSYLYGNHVIKGHLARMTENIPQYTGVVVFNLNDMPLGFGITAKSTLGCKGIEPMSTVVFN